MSRSDLRRDLDELVKAMDDAPQPTHTISPVPPGVLQELGMMTEKQMADAMSDEMLGEEGKSQLRQAMLGAMIDEAESRPEFGPAAKQLLRKLSQNGTLTRQDRFWFWWHLKLEAFYSWLLRRLGRP